MSKNDIALAKLALSATSGAAADGKAKNTVSVRLTNNGSVISGENIELTVTAGSALFSCGQQKIMVKTDVLGEASTGLTDITAETVTLQAILQSDTSIAAQTTSVFSGQPGGKYAAPVVREAAGGQLSSSVAQATVDILPFTGMAVDNEVVLHWYGKKPDGTSVPYTDKQTIKADDIGKTVTFVVPGQERVYPLAGGSLDVSYQITPPGEESEVLHLSVTSDSPWPDAPSVREAPNGVLSKSSPSATVDILPYAGMKSGDLVELKWNGDVSGVWSNTLTVTTNTTGKTLSFSVSDAHYASDAHVGVNYSITPADGGKIRHSLSLALLVR